MLIFDTEEAKVIFHSQDENAFIDFVNDIQDEREHTFILQTFNQCKGYLMNWCDDLKYDENF